MAFDEALAERIRGQLAGLDAVTEKKMFGGIGFMVGGNMAVGVHAEELIVRMDPAGHEAALRDPSVRVFEVGGRRMPGWLLVAPQGVATTAKLKKWVSKGTTYAGSLPPK